MEHEDLDELIEIATDFLAWVSKADIPEPLPIFMIITKQTTLTKIVVLHHQG